MMKFKFLPFALALLMLGACSNDNEFEKEGTVQTGEQGYVSMSINLPSLKGSRSVEYNDGTPEEYDVKEAKLLIFSNITEDEATAVCQGIYNLDISAFLGNDEEQITSTAQIVQEITKPEEANLYALVVLNDNGLITDDYKSKTFSEFYTAVQTLDVAKLNGNGFFMTNAPLSSKIGGTQDPTGAEVTTLAKIDANKIYRTEREALNSPATTVYVERALSKVTLEGASTTQTPSTGANPNIASYIINGWTLDNTNKSTFLVRNVTGISNWLAYNADNKGYRFVDGQAVETGVSLYRTHFGIDPNYSGAYTPSEQFHMVDKIPASLAAADGKTPIYCLENTFDVAGMKDINTTRAIVAATLNIKGAEDGGDFYLLNNNTNVIYQYEGVINEVKRLWMLKFETIASEHIKSGTFTADNVIVSLSNAEDEPQNDGGFTTVTKLEMTAPADVIYQEGKSLENINAAAQDYMNMLNGGLLTIAYYKSGVAYYEVLIKHFGDETPWEAPGTGTDSYPGRDESTKWLGRYGVLRNTWYALEVIGLKNIGSPEVPDVTEKWDDQSEQYISVEINILPWAKRSQRVEL